ncbi:MAG: peptide transporter substrate-binding protein [Thermomicrobiales bacterium]|jgi:peptide/nickel transport system substrate-binding protein|nr:peptide transporter substrate-binding protein [Thermomicrobiales bacterium]
MTVETQRFAQHLKTAYRAGRIDRREFFKWSAILGLAVPRLDLARAQDATPVPGGTLRFSVEPAATIEPHQLNDDPGIGTVHQVCEMLVDTDYDGNLQPRLATSWTPDEVGQVWTIALREGVTFHNGQSMTADDVVASFQRLVDPDSGSSAQATFDFLTPDGVRKVDEFTVEFALARPVVDFPAYLNSYQAVILPADWPGSFAENPIGTGAFQLVEFVPQQRVIYERYPDYWLPGVPYLDRVEAITLSSENAVTAMLGGSIEMNGNPAALPLFEGNPDIKALTISTSGHDGIFMRVDQEPFSDKRVRQAMALCMNRPDLIASVWQGLGELGNDNVFAPVFPLSSPPEEQRVQDYDRAKALLAEAGYAEGFSATLTTSSDTTPLPAMAAVVQEMLRPAGIEIEINAVPAATYFNTDWLETPLNITNWGGRATPSQYLSSAYTTGSVWNASHWSHAEFDDLVAQLDAELDFDKRKAIAREIATIMTEEVPAIIPFFINGVTFVRANVEGYVPDRIGFRDLRFTFFSSAD